MSRTLTEKTLDTILGLVGVDYRDLPLAVIEDIYEELEFYANEFEEVEWNGKVI